jgi:Uma2 family endonuclease
MVGIPVIDAGPMSGDEFYAFTDTRPDEEKWELIGGEPILNAAPSPTHQLIVANVTFTLRLRRSEINASWLVMPGPGIRLTDMDRPEPDVVVTSADQRLFALQKRDIESGIVAFEVLSPSTKGRDLDWKRAAYASLPSLTHYVAIVQDAVEVVVFARDDDFADRRIRSLAKTIELRSLAISLPVAEIYRDTHLAA